MAQLKLTIKLSIKCFPTIWFENNKLVMDIYIIS